MKRKYFAEIGQQFGRLTVIGPEVRKITPADPGGRPAMLCQCDCGRQSLVTLKALVSGRSKSCGRHGQRSYARLVEIRKSPEGRARAAVRGRRPENSARLRAWAQTPEGRAQLSRMTNSPERLERIMTHGLWKHPLYGTWVNMMHRCHNPDYVAYPAYGGRGIEVCAAWRDDVSAFIAWMDENLGPRPARLSLDRIDNDGNYEPGNLRWATASEQRRNQRSRKRSDPPVA